MLKLVSFHIQTHLNAFLQILEYFPHSVDADIGASSERITLYKCFYVYMFCTVLIGRRICWE